MPHYADGTEAKVGDQVTGKLYNSEGIKAGVIISITPGQESCNAQVQFSEAKPIAEDAVMPEAPRMCLRAPVEPHSPFSRIVKGEQHGSSGPQFVVFQCCTNPAEDYIPLRHGPSDGSAWSNHAWEIHSEEPLTISPSLLCTACKVHGFIRNGVWVPA